MFPHPGPSLGLLLVQEKPTATEMCVSLHQKCPSVETRNFLLSTLQDEVLGAPWLFAGPNLISLFIAFFSHKGLLSQRRKNLSILVIPLVASLGWIGAQRYQRSEKKGPLDLPHWQSVTWPWEAEPGKSPEPKHAALPFGGHTFTFMHTYTTQIAVWHAFSQMYQQEGIGLGPFLTSADQNHD